MTDNQNKKHQGQVKFYNITKGFGFVRDLDENSEEYFVHATSIAPRDDGSSRVLYDGEYIEFNTVSGDKGVQCIDVTGIRGGSLLCDANTRIGRGNRRTRQENVNAEPQTSDDSGAKLV